jgi:hypothetical protein
MSYLGTGYGKGSRPRPFNRAAWDANYDRIFRPPLPTSPSSKGDTDGPPPKEHKDATSVRS